MSYSNKSNLPPRDSHRIPNAPDGQQFRRTAGGQYRVPAEIPFLDPNYLKGTYFDSANNIKCELLTSEAEILAKKLKDSNVGYAQARRFFAAVRAIERDLENKAAYFVGRGQGDRDKKGRENLKRFIDANVELSARNEESFRKGFVPHFEAVIAYLRYYKPS